MPTRDAEAAALTLISGPTVLALDAHDIAGVLATNIMGRRVVKVWEDLLKRVPLVRGIYATIKSMMDVLSFQDKEKEKYSRVVMIEFPRKGQYALALVTGVTSYVDPFPLPVALSGLTAKAN